MAYAPWLMQNASQLQTLSALQDRLPPFPTDEAMAVIEAEVGLVSEIFSYITPEPIAAASLGQVSCCRLHLDTCPLSCSRSIQHISTDFI